jgi:hypothetical protein
MVILSDETALSANPFLANPAPAPFASSLMADDYPALAHDIDPSRHLACQSCDTLPVERRLHEAVLPDFTVARQQAVA